LLAANTLPLGAVKVWETPPGLKGPKEVYPKGENTGGEKPLSADKFLKGEPPLKIAPPGKTR